MHFPLWHYLKQPLWDKDNPIILNPLAYWRCYKVWYLDRCRDNAFLEQCWDVNYQDFVMRHEDLCNRTAAEEDPVWLLERCWHLARRSLYSFNPENDYEETDHPENHPSETEHS
ncbi:MAG: hypothetical protein AAFQ89_20445 [Cyanobacteria bacterium J06626_18]